MICARYKLFEVYVIVAALLVACAGPKSTPSTAPLIQHPWARPGLAGGNSAVYFIVDNTAGQADALIGVSGNVAESLELHRSQMDANGLMQMSHQERVEISAGEKLAFEPGGYHVMLIGLKQDLKIGDTFEVTLKFQHAGELVVTVEVSK